MFFQDNKCSWLVVKALQSDQEYVRAILSAHYGKKNNDDIAKIKNLYNELEIERQFHDFEDQSLERIDSLIGQFISYCQIPVIYFTEYRT